MQFSHQQVAKILGQLQISCAPEDVESALRAYILQHFESGLTIEDFNQFARSLRLRFCGGRQLFIDSTVTYDMRNPATHAL